MTMSNRKLFTLTITVLLVLVVALESGATMLVRMDLNALPRSANSASNSLKRLFQQTARRRVGNGGNVDRFRIAQSYTGTLTRLIISALLAVYSTAVPAVQAYSFAYTVGDMRLPSAQNGGTACPQPDRWNNSLIGGINR